MNEHDEDVAQSTVLRRVRFGAVGVSAANEQDEDVGQTESSARGSQKITARLHVLANACRIADSPNSGRRHFYCGSERLSSPEQSLREQMCKGKTFVHYFKLSSSIKSIR